MNRYLVSMTWERTRDGAGQAVRSATLEVPTGAVTAHEAIRKAVEASGYAEPGYRLQHVAAERDREAEFVYRSVGDPEAAT